MHYSTTHLELLYLVSFICINTHYVNEMGSNLPLDMINRINSWYLNKSGFAIKIRMHKKKKSVLMIQNRSRRASQINSKHTGMHGAFLTGGDEKTGPLHFLSVRPVISCHCESFFCIKVYLLHPLLHPPLPHSTNLILTHLTKTLARALIHTPLISPHKLLGQSPV